MESMDINVETPVSIVVNTGFANPTVVVLEVSLAAEAFPLIAAAVPPPAIIARAQVITGSRSVIVATIIAVPANVANGNAIVSSILSNHGI